MNIKYIRNQIELYKKEAEFRVDKMISLIDSAKHLDDETKNKWKQVARKEYWDFPDYIELTTTLHICQSTENWDKTWCYNMINQVEFLHAYHESKHGEFRYMQYLDSPELNVKGTLIITDPCYIISHSRQKDIDDWERCQCGSKMDVLGLENWITHETLYGDWSCTTFNKITKQPIGNFCADAGMVGVFLLDEILKYNPEFKNQLNHVWAITVIPDFQGKVQIIVKRHKHRYMNYSVYNDDDYKDYECQVIGKGVNFKTNESIEFIGKQTGI